MKRVSLVLSALLLSAVAAGCLFSVMGADRPTQKVKKPFRIERASDLGATLGASGLYTTTITKGAYQYPNSVNFQSLSNSFTSSALSILDQSVSSGSATSVMTAAGSGSMQMLYAYSTTIDGTLSIFNNTAGTGSAAASVAVTAGNPYAWDAVTSGTTALMLSPTNSISFTAGTTAGGLATSSTQTTVTAAAMYP